MALRRKRVIAGDGGCGGSLYHRLYIRQLFFNSGLAFQGRHPFNGSLLR